MLEHDLKWRDKTAAKTVLNARFGSQVEEPECDERTNFWINAYWLAARGRPYTHGIPIQLPPLDIIALIEKLKMAATPTEAVVVICAMDDAWIRWKDSK